MINAYKSQKYERNVICDDCIRPNMSLRMYVDNAHCSAQQP